MAALLTEYLPQLALGWSIILIAVISPGPAVALLLGVGASQGRAPALAIVAGIGASSLVWSTGTALGLAALFAAYAELVLVARIAGAAFMAYLAYKAFRAALAPSSLTPKTLRAKSLPGYALTGFVMQVSNPKAIFFWLAVASVGGVGDAPAPIVALFVLGCMAISVSGHGAYALLLSSSPVRLVYERSKRWVEATLGLFFAFFAFKLATDRG